MSSTNRECTGVCVCLARRQRINTVMQRELENTLNRYVVRVWECVCVDVRARCRCFSNRGALWCVVQLLAGDAMLCVRQHSKLNDDREDSCGDPKARLTAANALNPSLADTT